MTTDFKFFGESSGQPPSIPGAGSMALAGGTRSLEDWRKELRGKPAPVAYELVITDDTVPAYQAYVELYARDTRTPRLRGTGAAAPDAGTGARHRDQHPRLVRGLSRQLG